MRWRVACSARALAGTMNRRALSIWTAILGVGMLIGLAVALLGTLRPSERARALGVAYLDLEKLAPGEFREFNIPRGPIFAFRPTAQNWADLRAFSDQVRDAGTERFNSRLGVFLYYGFSTHFGCRLIHRPKSDPDINEYHPGWPGGYSDKCHGELYDYAGRVVKGSPAQETLYAVSIRNIKRGTVEVDPSRAR